MVEVIDFHPSPGQKKLLLSKKRFIFAMGGNRGGKCVSADTKIAGQRVDSFGFEKGTDQLHLVNGSLRSTDAHVLLAPDGWVSVGERRKDGGSLFFQCPLLTTGDISLSDFLGGAHCSWQTVSGFQENYLAYFRSNGGQPQSLEALGSDASPSQVGALACSFSHLYERERSHLYQSSYPLSNFHDLHPCSQSYDVEDRDDVPFSERTLVHIRKYQLSDLPSKLRTKVLSGTSHQKLSSSFVYLILFPESSIYTIAVAVNSDIKQDKVEPFWDTSIPLIHAYEAGGFINHNSCGGVFWSFQAMNIPGTHGLILTNTYDQMSLAIKPLFFDEWFPSLKKYWKERDRALYLPNGSIVFFRSLDQPNYLKGPNIHWIWVDEADMLSRPTWDIIRSRVSLTQGSILLTSSIYPNGWIYSNIYRPMNDPEDDAYKTYVKNYEFITWESRENPKFNQEEWDLLKATTDPVTFAREYESKFAFNTGKVFGGILDYGVIDKVPDNVTILKYVYGLDYGINDPTAIIVVGYGSDRNWYIVDEFYKPHVSIQDVNYYLEHFIKMFGIPYKTCQDYAGGIARLSLVNEANVVDADKQIDGGIKLLRDLIYQKKIYVLRNCTNTLKEIDNYQFKDQDGHRDEPEDRWNHAMDAMRYAIHTCFFELCGLEVKEEQEEDLPAFWERKKEQGLYKNGNLIDNKEGENSYVDDDYNYID